MKSSKRHVTLLSLIFLLKCLSKSVFIRNYFIVMKSSFFVVISLCCLILRMIKIHKSSHSFMLTWKESFKTSACTILCFGGNFVKDCFLPLC